MELDGEGFVRASLGLVESGRDSPGYPPLMTLLARSDQMINQLCDPDAFSKEASIELARKLVCSTPSSIPGWCDYCPAGIEHSSARRLARPSSASWSYSKSCRFAPGS